MMAKLKEKGLDKSVKVDGKNPLRPQKTIYSTKNTFLNDVDYNKCGAATTKNGVTVLNIKKTKAMLGMDNKKLVE